jgi:hypothetical protein
MSQISAKDPNSTLILDISCILHAVLVLLLGSFYVPRSNPDGVDINVRCLDNWNEIKLNHKIIPFDGVNWEENSSSLAHLSKEGENI